MNNSIKINDKNHTIELTKKFAAAAKRFGTSEYEDLQRVRHDYPNYRVVIRTVSKKADSFKGLTFAYMENYIKTKNDEDNLRTFYTLCGKTEEGKDQDFGARASYGEVRKWFLDTYEEVKKYSSKINDILNKQAA